MPQKLRKKQQEILNYIRTFEKKNGRSPTVREAAAAMGRAPSTIQFHMRKLREAGVLEKVDPGTSCRVPVPVKGRRTKKTRANEEQEAEKQSYIPVLRGDLRGMPVFRPDNVEEYLPMPRGENEDLFAVKMPDTSMTGAALLTGDLVVADRNRKPQNGDLAVILKDRNVAVRSYHRAGKDAWLAPANLDPAYREIPAHMCTILGCVVRASRKYK